MKQLLKKSGLIVSPKRGLQQITEAGRKAIDENPNGIDAKYLEQFESFREFTKPKPKSVEIAPESRAVETSDTPAESIDAAFEQLQQELTGDLLEKVKDCTPYFFETVVMRLLRAMGYGGVTGSGKVTPASHDGGIDGVIHEDKLGLDTVCIQAKQWENTVGRPKVQEFVGSMDLHRSKKGVILTTSRFSPDAYDYVNRIEGKTVVLIDGDKLCQLMIEHRVGVTPKRNYELLDISEDFFDEDE